MTIYQYVLNHLSVLTDEELAEVDFDAGLSIIDNCEIESSEKEKLKDLFSRIQKELPIHHHGIKGMKWGVRRYQNKDGSLTPAGKQRVADETAKQSLFGTASKYQVKTRSGEIITVEPVKPISAGKKIYNALMGFSEKDDMGRRGDANYTLTDSNGKKIGELSLISKNSKTAYADWITIDESQRGKGYATDIINDLLVKAKDAGYSKVELNALKKPRPLYERLGFEYVDTSKLTIMDRINGFEVGAKRMEYDLDKLRHSQSTQYHNISIGRLGSMEYELYHHGVKGMKWGVRKKKAKTAYKNATNKAFAKYERDIAEVEKGYKRGQMLSEKDQAREAKIESQYAKSVAKAKATYKKEKQNIASEKKAVRSENARSAIKKGSKIATNLLIASTVDDIFYGGAGKKVVKAATVQAGRAAVSAYVYARGGRDIHWYDN